MVVSTAPNAYYKAIGVSIGLSFGHKASIIGVAYRLVAWRRVLVLFGENRGLAHYYTNGYRLVAPAAMSVL